MNERDTEQRTAGEILREKKRRRRWLAVLLVLAVAVSAGTLWAFHYQGIAATYQKQVLDCHAVSGMVSHVHNDDCYRNGELVCPLEEIEPHQHTEACYTSVLFCGLEESEGHQHTEACFIPQMELGCGLEETDGDETHPAHHHTAECYAPVRELICGLEETPGDETHPAHWHTDECYQDVKLLICGMEEGEGAHHHTDACYEQVLTCEKPALPVHVHGPECFRMEDMTEEEIAAMNLADETPENIETTGTGPVEETVLAENYPEQHFEGEAAGLLVSVNAPAGAFPQGTEMVVSPIEDEEVLNAATAEVQGEVVLVQGVDISFFDAEGNEIEPLVPIQVEMVPSQESAGIIPDITEVSNEQTLVHVDSELAATVMEQEDNTTPEVRFESDSFSAYIIVYTKIETSVLASDGNNYKITVTAPDDAPFPENAKLWTSEIEVGANAYGVTYLEYLTKTEYALGWESGSTTYVRLFDIFVGDEFGNKLSLTTPVDVKIELLDKEAGTESSVVHFGTKTEVLASATEGQTVSFETSSLTVYAVAESTITQYVLASDGQNYKISLTYGPDAGIPDGAELVAKEVVSGETADGSMSYEDYAAKAERTLDENVRLTFARFFDITIMVDGTEFQPLAPVEVKIELAEAQDQASEDVKALHFYDDGGIRTIPTNVEEQTVSFNADGFSVYGIIGTETIEATYITADGKTLKVTVNYDEKAQIPEGATLEVKEISEGDEGWEDRSARLAKSLSDEYGNYFISDARFLDISILVDGEEIEPKAPVEIKIEYIEPMQTEYEVDYVDTDPNGTGEYAGFEEAPEMITRFAVVHYKGEEPEILDAVLDKSEDLITESISLTSEFSEYDFVNFDVYEAPEADNDYSAFSSIKSLSASDVANLTEEAPRPRSAGDIPAHSKTLKDNNDGTYTIGLNVTGDADTTSEASDVNVLVVYDVSSSMTIYHAPSNTGRYGAPPSAYSTTYPTLYQRTGNNSYVALDNDNYSGTVYTRSGNYGRYTYNEYTGKRYSALWRADVAEQTLYNFVHSLFGYQNADKDNINAAVITFDASAHSLPRNDLPVTWTTNESDITQYLKNNGTSHNTALYGSGTNWEAALDAANDAVAAITNDHPTYVVFITDGAPTNRNNSTNRDVELCYEAARDEARDVYNATTQSGGEFFGIYAYGEEADWLASLMYYGYNNAEPPSNIRGTTFDTDGYYNAASTEDLTAAINAIFQKIVQTLGVSAVSIDDGTTSNVSTGTGVAHLLEVDESSYQYWLSMPVTAGSTAGTYTFTMVDKVSGNPVNYTATPNTSTGEVTITWDGGTATYPGNVNLGTLTLEWTGAKAFYNVAPPAANYNTNTGEVEWNLNPAGTLLDGVTYTVTFDCYPSQYTLDLITDLKNGYVTYGDTSYGDVWDYLVKDDDDNYTLKTNTTATLTYTDTRISDQPQTIDYVNPDPEPVTATEEMAVSKNWSNTLDSRDNWISQTIHLYVTRDGVERNYVTLNAANNWSGASWISYGIMTIGDDGTIDLKTTGHDYSFSEEVEVGYYWEIKADTIRPMLINNHITTLKLIKEAAAPDAVKTQAENAVAVLGENTYYKLTINGEVKYYVVDEGAASLNATNHRRSYLDVLKNVTGGNAAGDEFEFTMTVTNARASGADPDDTHSDAWVWFSIADSNNSYAIVTDPDIATATGIRWQLNDYPDNGTVVNTKPEAENFNGYFCVPSGTTITVNMQNGYSLRFINLPEGSAYSVAESTTMPANDYSFVSIAGERGYDASGVKEDPNTDWTTETAGTVSGQAISGSIDYVESAYKVTVTNKRNAVDVQLKKVQEDGETVLSGSSFDLATLNSNNIWVSVQTGITPGAPAADGHEAVGNPIDLGGLGIGQYKLTETKSPDGYIILTKDVYFEVYKDTDGSRKARLTDENGNPIESPTDVAAIEGPGTGDTPIYTITVTNTPGVELPQTGGPGAELFEAIGGIMMALAFAVMVIRKRKIA